MWFVLSGCHCVFKTKVILDVPPALMLLILIILVTNSFQSIERLMKRSMRILYRSIVHYKAHCLCNLAASIFPNKQKSQRQQLLKPACGLLMRNLNCMKAIMMLLFQAIGLLMRWVLPRLLWGICSLGPVSVPLLNQTWVTGAGGRLWVLLVMPPCSQFADGHLHLLHLQCCKGNASELRGAYSYGSCGTWKGWKRFKGGSEQR